VQRGHTREPREEPKLNCRCDKTAERSECTTAKAGSRNSSRDSHPAFFVMSTHKNDRRKEDCNAHSDEKERETGRAGGKDREESLHANTVPVACSMRDVLRRHWALALSRGISDRSSTW
jgi:hypothetical protein